ncbi:MAG: FkbM family methyltransferase [Acidobacteriota bacterium]
MNISTFIYTVVLRPKPLNWLANALIRAIVPRYLKTRGAIIALNPGDPVISGALTFGVYEKAETAFFCRTCKPGMTFLDIGANVGYFTALAIPRIGNGRIIALEPQRESFGFLERTVAANSARNVTLVRKAASSRPGVVTLYSSSTNRGDNRLYPNEFADSESQVETCAIDHLLNELNVATVHLVKIDVQGHEGHVLAGMTNLLRTAPDITILLEFWPEGLRKASTRPEDLLDSLEAAGLQLFELGGKGELNPLDKQAIIARNTGRKYTNIVARRGGAAQPEGAP